MKAQHTTATQIEEDHDKVNKSISSLKVFMETEFSSEKYSEWKLDFLWRLRDFKNCLQKHFDLEEEGGFMRDVLKQAPHSEHKVYELRAEHEQFELIMDEIIFQLKDMREKQDDTLSSLKVRLNGLFDMLKKHENQEHRLLQQAYFREYGGPH